MTRPPLAAALSALALVGVTAVTPTTEAHAAPQPWHVKSSVNSDAQAYIYGEPDCSSAGSSHEMWPGDTATSLGWDCARVWGNPYTVKVYSGSTGALIVTRSYSANEKFTLYNANDYLITVN